MKTGESVGKPVREGGVGAQVYDTIRTMVLNLQLPPGAPLVETELSASIGVSRTPIREALARLAREGLVRQYPGRGAFVSEISLPDLIELYQMREALETHATRLAAHTIREGHPTDAIAGLLDRLEEERAALQGGDDQSYYELVTKMDGLIVQLAGNKRLGIALSEIWAQISRARRVAKHAPSRLVDTVDEHRAILAAIQDGDAERAASETRRHVRNSLANIKMVLQTA